MLEDVGRNLRRIRRERDLTQEQVARFVGIRQQELSAIERGLRPPLALLDRLSKAVGVHPNELIRTPAESEATGRAGAEDHHVPA